MGTGLISEENWAVIGQTTSFLTVILETIVGVVLFFIWTILMGWKAFSGLFMILEWIQLGVLVFTFFLNFLMIHTRLAGFLSTIRKTLITGFLSLLTLTSIIIASISPQLHDTLGNLYPIPTGVYIVSVFVGYMSEFYVGREELGRILDSDEDAESGITRLLSEKRVLSEKIYYSLLLALGIWGLSLGINSAWERGGASVIVQNGPMVTFLILIGFFVGLGIASFITIRKHLPKLR